MTMALTFVRIYGVWALHFICCITVYYPVLAQETQLKILHVNPIHQELGGVSNLTCKVEPAAANITWLFDGKIVNNTDGKVIKGTKNDTYSESVLTIASTKKNDSGEYICMANLGADNITAPALLNLSFPAVFVPDTKIKDTYYVDAIDVNSTTEEKHSVTLRCVFKTFYLPDQIEWKKADTQYSENVTWIDKLETQVESKRKISRALTSYNGSYECTMFDKHSSSPVTGIVHLIVYGKPEVTIDDVIGINTTELYVKWSVNLFNSEVTDYSILFSNSTPFESFIYTPKKPERNATSFVITDLEAGAEYAVKVDVTTKHGTHRSDMKTNRTLEKVPEFVPNIAINGFSATSVTIGWAPPPQDIAHLIHYYELQAKKKNDTDFSSAYHSRDSRNLPYMFDNLLPYTTYIFKVRACQEFAKVHCWKWSEEMTAATLDGTPGEPSNAAATCSDSQMTLTWAEPIKVNAEIKGYMIELTGFRQYRENKNRVKNETWGPLSRFMGSDSRTTSFEGLFPNAEYTARLTAVTRTRRRGAEVTVKCSTPQSVPDRKPSAKWTKFYDKEKDRYLFLTQLTKVPEKNGPICCYRVHIVRLPARYEIKDLMTTPQMLNVIQYEEAHSVHFTLGSYITDILTNDDFQENDVLTLITGDGKVIFNASNPALQNGTCERCLLRPVRQQVVFATPPPKTTTTTEVEEATTTDTVDEKSERRRRNVENANKEHVQPMDGPLDPQANYTFFIELIPAVPGMEPIYSEYQNILRPAPSPIASEQASPMEIALQATCAVAALLLLLAIVFCVLQSRRARKQPPLAQLEMNPLHSAITYLLKQLGLSSGGGRAPMTSAPDMPPIAAEDLARAYSERHADSDLGFQREFELLQLLSECLPDRSTYASEARENQPKNRYPDIKAYDQTRVKLSQVDGITGSDYINANYVRGYTEPKKFICAQGPTDTTVNDFWRMIWEHGLELVVMLTNLEEYSKVKCSKYWPDEVKGTKAFGNVLVHHASEKRYSDYIVREFKISKQPTTAEGQPIVENNGIAKRNGDIKDPESVPTSPREHKDSTETRIVKQYHFLMWKDFAAPEHPYSILKFIKRVNEAWSGMLGRPVVVHCSAGVGRTGTLVALDCLLQQLKATGHVTVFNTIAELRRQRNFLVQSQKQYVFVYRALVEYAHFGDTEIAASKLKSSVHRLRNTPEGADKSLMELEFEKILEWPSFEPLRPSAAGQADEVRARNRTQDCLPYDKNRVMLAPLPSKDFSTYINASFIEAYDNSEGFIITQDPLPNTILDFWRMVSEQGVATIVMLSELGEGKCPRYWDDGSVQYEHLTVQYDESESCPYYTRRQFRVTNNKTGHTCSVRQLQYHGWPTAPGHVPEVTRGVAELADAAAPDPLPSSSSGAGADARQPMLVHCNSGTERSALFVALCVLIAQLRVERRVDVGATARKVRAQRERTIDTFLQYEFLHRAILNYAELHNLLEDS